MIVFPGTSLFISLVVGLHVVQWFLEKVGMLPSHGCQLSSEIAMPVRWKIERFHFFEVTKFYSDDSDPDT